jgi:hypothetical protein
MWAEGVPEISSQRFFSQASVSLTWFGDQK